LFVDGARALKFDKATRVGAGTHFWSKSLLGFYTRSLALRRQYLFTSSGKSNNAPKLKSPTETPKWTAKLKIKTQKLTKCPLKSFAPLSLCAEHISLSLSPHTKRMYAEAEGMGNERLPCGFTKQLAHKILYV
jgi:hypothetical protein